MTRVIVTVKKDGEQQSRDLEVPVEMTMRQLGGLIARALGWDVDASGRPAHYQIAAQPPGRILRDDETLADAQVWDGSWLVFYALQPGGAQPEGDVIKGLVRSWQPLTAAENTAGGPPPEERPLSSGGWKQLDD